MGRIAVKVKAQKQTTKSDHCPHKWRTAFAIPGVAPVMDVCELCGAYRPYTGGHSCGYCGGGGTVGGEICPDCGGAGVY